MRGHRVYTLGYIYIYILVRSLAVQKNNQTPLKGGVVSGWQWKRECDKFRGLFDCFYFPIVVSAIILVIFIVVFAFAIFQKGDKKQLIRWKWWQQWVGGIKD